VRIYSSGNFVASPFCWLLNTMQLTPDYNGELYIDITKGTSQFAYWCTEIFEILLNRQVWDVVQFPWLTGQRLLFKYKNKYSFIKCVSMAVLTLLAVPSIGDLMPYN
jgi:hypothetical protein